MGLYDSFFGYCKCGNQIEIQTKAGECSLESLSLDRVPSLIALSVMPKSYRCVCGRVWGLRERPRLPASVDLEWEEL